MLNPSPDEIAQRNAVVALVLEFIERGETIRLPAFVRGSESSVGQEPNPFGGLVGDFRYQIEGEEDLLHLLVVRQDLGQISIEEGHAVASFMLNGVPPMLVWLRPGMRSHHFYVGHDDLVGAIKTY